MRRKTPVWLVMRRDDYADHPVVVQVRLVYQEAADEVRRLLDLNKDKGSYYWLSSSRLVVEDESATPFDHPAIMLGYPMDADEEEACWRVLKQERETPS